MQQSRVRVKICGMRSEQDVMKAITLGVDALGFIFYSKSPRFVSIERVQTILATIPPFVSTVAVVVNPGVEEVQQIIKQLPIQCLQFHGDEPPAFCAQFDKPYIKAIAATSTKSISESMELYHHASAILLDTPSLNARGGTGETFDWSIIPGQRSKPIILAGGINVSNVQAAMYSTQPYAIDLCSGVETSPGVKSHDKMIHLMSALRDFNNEQ